MFKEEQAQISAELILLIGSVLIIFIITFSFILTDNELNQAILAAKEGVNTGLITDGVAVFPENKYREYSQDKQVLLHPNPIHLIKIEYKDNGFDTARNKTKIQFKVYVSSSQITSSSDRESAGERINFNLRKSLAISFNTTSLTNTLYNPVYSQNYIFTTANVVWM